MPVNTSEDGNYLSSEKKKLMIQKVINNLSKSHSVRRLSISRELWGWGVGGRSWNYGCNPPSIF